MSRKKSVGLRRGVGRQGRGKRLPPRCWVSSLPAAPWPGREWKEEGGGFKRGSEKRERRPPAATVGRGWRGGVKRRGRARGGCARSRMSKSAVSVAAHPSLVYVHMTRPHPQVSPPVPVQVSGSKDGTALKPFSQCRTQHTACRGDHCPYPTPSSPSTLPHPPHQPHPILPINPTPTSPILPINSTPSSPWTAHRDGTPALLLPIPRWHGTESALRVPPLQRLLGCRGRDAHFNREHQRAAALQRVVTWWRRGQYVRRGRQPVARRVDVDIPRCGDAIDHPGAAGSQAWIACSSRERVPAMRRPVSK